MEDEEILSRLSNLSLQIESLQTAMTSESQPNIVNLPHTITSGHNMFGYTGSNGIDVAEALIAATGDESILDRVRIIKNQAGVFWTKEYNGLGSMVYGTGYYLYNYGESFVVTWI